MENIGSYVHKLPMLVKKILERRKVQSTLQADQDNLFQLTALSEVINRSFYMQEGRYLNLGVKKMSRRMKEV